VFYPGLAVDVGRFTGGMVVGEDNWNNGIISVLSVGYSRGFQG
jgi:hypothetical protein